MTKLFEIFFPFSTCLTQRSLRNGDSNNNLFLFFVMVSIILWIIPFLIRLFLIDLPKVENDIHTQNIVTKTIDCLYNGDKYGAFLMIFSNNLKGCMFNIIGGIMFSVVTIFNLISNGFFSADTFSLIHQSGVDISDIFKRTLPHSFELIGFWLSAGIGFSITWNLILLIKGEQCFTRKFYKRIGLKCVIVFVIILSAAYVEAYISSTL